MHSRCNLEQSCQGLLPFLVLIVIHDVWPKRGVKLKLFEALHHVGNYWPLLLGVQVHGEMTVRAEKDWVCVCGGGGAKGIWNCFWLNRISCFVANILLPAIGLKKRHKCLSAFMRENSIRKASYVFWCYHGFLWKKKSCTCMCLQVVWF